MTRKDRIMIRLALMCSLTLGLVLQSGCASTLKASLTEACKQRCNQVGPSVNSIQDCYKQCEGKSP